MQDGRTYHALEKKKEELLNGEIVKIGKHKYHINSTFFKTSQDAPVYEIMQDDIRCYYIFYKKFTAETCISDHWVISNNYD